MALIPDPSMDRTVRIPVVIREGRVERYPEGALPDLKEGSVGELLLASLAVVDEKLRKKLIEDRTVPFLKSGTTVLMKLRALPDEEKGLLDPKSVAPSIETFQYPSAYAGVRLLETLRLQFQGTRPPSLRDCTCRVEALDCHAQSLNHAYTLLSQKFEPKRRTHVANVFHVCFVFDDGFKGYRLLDDLRRDREALWAGRLAR